MSADALTNLDALGQPNVAYLTELHREYTVGPDDLALRTREAVLRFAQTVAAALREGSRVDTALVAHEGRRP
jgi:hypothetical protein